MIDFLKYRSVCMFISIAIIASFVGVYFYKQQTRGHAFSYSIDFTGGTQVLLKFQKPVNSAHVVKILEEQGWKGAHTRDFSGANEILVRVKEFSNDAKGLADRIAQAVNTAMPDNPAEILQSEGVGAGVGASLRWKAIQAVLLACLLIALYIAMRFQFSFAVGAVVSLMHDALVILACFLFIDKDISINMIGAVLTILGYSINDTIIIFTRIRENFKLMRGATPTEVVNTSINQTLRRTILTSTATMLVVVSLLIFGGEVLRDLSLALLVGIVFGTYSSIYIASPVMLMLRKEK
jgi:preprotein translocase SecF subunit